jgi:signal transduction histidine kinase
MNPVRRKRNRILLLFVLGVGVPSLLLGYLAFRGIQNDQALLEKENREELQTLVQKVTAQVDENISDVEEDFKLALGNEWNPEDPSKRQSLQKFKEQNPLVEETFIFQNGEKITFPASKLLYLSEDNIESASVSQQDSNFQKQLRSAQQAEFQEKNYRKAAAIYRQLFAKIQSLSMKGDLLNSLARVQKKANLIPEAIDTYRQIMRDYDQVRSSAGIPLGLAAGCELASLLFTAENPESALQVYIDIFKALVGKKWTLERAQYDFYSSKTTEVTQEILSGEELGEKADSFQNDIRALKEKEAVERERNERLLAFQENAPAEFQPLSERDSLLSPNGNKRIALEIGGYFYLVSLFGDVEGKNIQGRTFWGLLIHQEFLKTEVITRALRNFISSNKTGWIVKNKSGESLLSSEPIPSGTIQVQSSFAGNFPDWRIELYQQDPRLFEAFLTSRRGIYFFIFLLIGGILIFGLVLTVRTVSHELELSRMKSDFVSTISHEFKSPLTSIRQLAEMLQSGRVPSEERRQKYYDVLVEQSERLTLLTENVLNFAKMEEGKKVFKFEPVDIGGLLEDIVSTLQERVRHDGFELQLIRKDVLPSVLVDSSSLTQAINNLLDNAIKYSGESKRIVVEAEAEDEHLIISVRDFGLGIKREEQERVFERFFRGGDELTRTVKGSGLGLTLVKQIVEAHKGSVNLESELGQGSTFSIKLPLYKPKEKRHG